MAWDFYCLHPVLSYSLANSWQVHSLHGILLKQEVKESQEIIQARRAADIASKKSLFEQLSDQQEKKKEEYDKNTKLIFGMSSC